MYQDYFDLDLGIVNVIIGKSLFILIGIVNEAEGGQGLKNYFIPI